jgi:hypothetical protein
MKVPKQARIFLDESGVVASVTEIEIYRYMNHRLIAVLIFF